MKKIISLLLIYCLVIQIPLTHLGCTSFYPTEENKSLSNYNNYEGRILLKLKDNTELEITPKNSFFVDRPSELIYGSGLEFNYTNKKNTYFTGIIEKDMIDSTKLIEYNSNQYIEYWMKDNRKLTMEVKKLLTITPDSGSNFWLVMDNNKDEIRKIYDSDIEEIQVLKTNWVTTSFLISGGIVLVSLIYLIINPPLGRGPIFSGHESF